MHTTNELDPEDLHRLPAADYVDEWEYLDDAYPAVPCEAGQLIDHLSAEVNGTGGAEV